MDKVTKIKISGKEYPIRFDYTTLKEVSERYPSIRDFEMKLLGMEVVGKNDDGTEKIAVTKDPSISLLIFLVPLMVNTALDYMNCELVDEKEIVRDIDLNYTELASILHKEMNRCFKTMVVQKKSTIRLRSR